MKVSIGLPSTIPNIPGSLIRDWAIRADEGPFSSLGTIDRLVYGNVEPLIALAVAAGVTRRIRLMTGVLLAPLRTVGTFAKQAASLDRLSDGRLTLGLGVGVREDDYRAAPASFQDRGRRFEQQLAVMTRVWSGQPVDDETGPIGPAPVQSGGPEILIGGQTPAAISRVARWGNGFFAGDASPDRISGAFRQVEEYWRNEARPGKPRLAALAYFGLGTDAADRVCAYILDFYSFLGPVAHYIAGAALTTPEAVKSRLQAFADIGTDELVLNPCIPELDQVSRLEDIVGG